MEIEYMLCIVAQHLQCFTAIPLASAFTINNDAYFGTTVGWTKIEEINNPKQLPFIATLNHQTKLFVGIEVMSIGLNILLQQIARIGHLTCRYHPLTGIILHMEKEVQIPQFRSAKTKSRRNKIHRNRIKEQ